MKYRVTHLTEYLYGERVPLCHNLVRIRPRDTPLQNCLEHEFTIEPRPAVRRERIDFFGNHVTWISVQEPHPRLRLKAVSEVEVTPAPVVDGQQGVAWEDVAALFSTTLRRDYLDATHFRFESPQIPLRAELANYARPSFAARRPLLPAVKDLTLRIFREFTFDPRATTVGTPVMEVLTHRRGVCQDFAHLQIACLRSLGLAARYVSGYIVTHPPEGQKRLVGADASHAWVSVFIPEIGWVDFDPTNGLLPVDEHITLGWGRDYDDLSPVKGVITGGRGHSLKYSVDVEPLTPRAKPENFGTKRQPATAAADSKPPVASASQSQAS